MGGTKVRMVKKNMRSGIENRTSQKNVDRQKSVIEVKKISIFVSERMLAQILGVFLCNE